MLIIGSRCNTQESVEKLKIEEKHTDHSEAVRGYETTHNQPVRCPSAEAVDIQTL